ncbi:hypothetical protein KBB68_00815 [Candidatus Babeliales bacterium]|nr:hypothetical protein [Candidatus Babeliales bacterium]
MYKKIMLTFLMLCPVQTKPLFMEFFATIGFIATVRTKPVRQVINYAWFRYIGSSKPALSDFKMAQSLAKFDTGSMLALGAYAMRAKAMISQSGANLASVLVAVKNRIKNPVVVATDFSQTTIQSTSKNGWMPYDSFFRRKTGKSLSNESGASGSFYNQISQVNAQQNNYGLFHWCSNGGRSEAWAQEFGKKRFWQGFAAGGFGMAWLMKSRTDTSKKEKVA